MRRGASWWSCRLEYEERRVAPKGREVLDAQTLALVEELTP
jgi:hypothetical protein